MAINNKQTKSLHGFWLIAFCLFSGACANIVAPSGGPKDTEPPKIVAESPENFSKRFTGNIIKVQFNEYIQLDNPAQEVVISPAMETEPEISVKGRELRIAIKAKLDSATTYTINFGEALKDANEGNALSGFKYVFSTGDELDSLSVRGSVTVAKDDKPAGKVLALLYKEMADSAVLTKKPFYFAKTNSEGKFSLDNIKAGSYRLFALKDENFNYIYDLPNEEIAFLQAPVQADSMIENIELFLFREKKNLPPALVSADDTHTDYLKLIFSAGVKTFSAAEPHNPSPAGITEYNTTRDTVTLWRTHALKSDTLLLHLNAHCCDTLALPHEAGGFDSLKSKLPPLALVASRDNAVAPEGMLKLQLNRPVKTAALERLTVAQDSPLVALTPSLLRFTDSVQRTAEMDFKRTEGTAYTITLPEGMLTDYFGNRNDSLRWKIVTKTAEDYASLKLMVSGREGGHYILQMLDRNGAVAREEIFNGKSVFNFTALSPGMYEIKIIFDENANGTWDSGSLAEHLQPEKTYLHPEKINLRANWEMEVDLTVR